MSDVKEHRDKVAGIGPQDSNELRAYKQCLHDLGWCPGIHWSEEEGLVGHDLPTYMEYLSLKHDFDGLRETLQAMSDRSPPDDWVYYPGAGEYAGYGNSGGPDYVDEPDYGNFDEMFNFGISVGEWYSAVLARKALATRQAKDGGEGT